MRNCLAHNSFHIHCINCGVNEFGSVAGAFDNLCAINRENGTALLKVRQENERLKGENDEARRVVELGLKAVQVLQADLSAHALALKEAREVLKDLSFRMAIDVREGTIYHAEKISSQMCRIILDFLAQPASAFVERASKAAKIQEAAAVLLDAMRNDGEKTPGRPRTTPEQLESAYQRLGEAMGVFGQAASATRAEG